MRSVSEPQQKSNFTSTNEELNLNCWIQILINFPSLRQRQRFTVKISKWNKIKMAAPSPQPFANLPFQNIIFTCFFCSIFKAFSNFCNYYDFNGVVVWRGTNQMKMKIFWGMKGKFVSRLSPSTFSWTRAEFLKIRARVGGRTSELFFIDFQGFCCRLNCWVFRNFGSSRRQPPKKKVPEEKVTSCFTSISENKDGCDKKVCHDEWFIRRQKTKIIFCFREREREREP